MCSRQKQVYLHELSMSSLLSLRTAVLGQSPMYLAAPNLEYAAAGEIMIHDDPSSSSDTHFATLPFLSSRPFLCTDS